MANEKNLLKGKATQFQAGEKQARIAAKGGKASGAAKRAKKTRRELAAALASAKINDPKLKTQLEALGFGSGDLFNDSLIVASVFRNAISGDMKAVEKWEEWTKEQEQKDAGLARQIDGARQAFRESIQDFLRGSDGTE